ncbi:SRPBCC family protein [Flavobacterium sp. W1B]|uniref:SRPBCC family protein n=1 Tax=Flavobacterium sp. W1B TaxID=3394146 RepID=UPI0039BCA3E0
MAQDWTSFKMNIGVKASLQEMYDAWTKSDKMEQWFLASCKYSGENQNIDQNQNAIAGNTYEWTWFLYDGIEKGKIVAANGKDFFQFTFAGECLVDIELTQKGEYVLVTLTQKNIPTDEKSKFNIRIGCVEGWTFFLTNLKSVYENCSDLRNKNPELKGVNG